jgi:hypothetical protein
MGCMQEDSDNSGIRLITSPDGVPNGKTAAIIALRHGRNPVAAYFAAEFESRMRARADAQDRDKIKVNIAPLRSGGFRADVDFVPSAGAHAQHAHAKFVSMQQLVSTMNAIFLKSPSAETSKDGHATLLVNTPKPQQIDYKAGMEWLYGQVYQSCEISRECRLTKEALKAQLISGMKALLSKQGASETDFTVMVQLEPAGTMDDAGAIGVSAQLDFYRLPTDIAVQLNQKLAHLAATREVSQTKQKYAIAFTSLDAMVKTLRTALSGQIDVFPINKTVCR